eukprot:Hpha_TRINITY_DN10636_c0_g1::TRINITY_DN10636_c0_g1_i1::g.156887::m.156887
MFETVEFRRRGSDLASNGEGLEFNVDTVTLEPVLRVGTKDIREVRERRELRAVSRPDGSRFGVARIQTEAAAAAPLEGPMVLAAIVMSLVASQREVSLGGSIT